MSDSKDRIIELIRKLQEVRFDRGATPAEAEAAAAHVQRLLITHNLTMFDVDTGKFDEGITDEPVVAREPGNDDNLKTIPAWMSEMVGAVAYPNDCRIIFCPRYSEIHGWYYTIQFVGHESDVKVAVYLYVTLSQALWYDACRTARRRGIISMAKAIAYRRDFMYGAASAIHKRLKAEKIAATQAPDTGGKCTALVHVKSVAVTEFVDKEYGELKSLKVGSVKDRDAIGDGYRAGQSIALRRGLEGQDESRILPGVTRSITNQS